MTEKVRTVEGVVIDRDGHEIGVSQQSRQDSGIFTGSTRIFAPKNPIAAAIGGLILAPVVLFGIMLMALLFFVLMLFGKKRVFKVRRF